MALLSPPFLFLLFFPSSLPLSPFPLSYLLPFRLACHLAIHLPPLRTTTTTTSHLPRQRLGDHPQQAQQIFCR